MPITGFVSSCLGIALPSISLDPATSAWVSAVIANGGTVSAGRRTLVSNLIVGLKADGVWTKLDRLWIFAAENTPSALTDMVAVTLATAHGSPSFAANRGYTGVDFSSTVWIDSGVNLSTYGGQFSTNSGHISVWSDTSVAASIDIIMGSSEGGAASNATEVYPFFSDSKIYFYCSDSDTSLAAGFTVTSSIGHFIANRSGASADQGYINGSNVINPNISAGTAPANVNMAILANNDSTFGVSNGSACEVTMSSIGGTLSSTDATNFYNRLRTYMTAVGVP